MTKELKEKLDDVAAYRAKVRREKKIENRMLYILLRQH